jgi:hypothetical protein
MNKFMKCLGTMVLTAYAGCASQPQAVEAPKAPQKMTHEYLSQVEQRVLAIDADGKRSKAESEELSKLYAIVNSTKPEKDADAGTKEHYSHVLRMLSAAQKDNYDNMKFYLVLTGVDTAEFRNVPGNIGGTRALPPVTGEYLVKALGEKRAYEIMSKAVPVEAYNGMPVSPGDIMAGGGRLAIGSAHEITMADARKIVGRGIGRLTENLYRTVTNGKKEDGEMSRAFVVAETCKGYALPRPDEKK